VHWTLSLTPGQTTPIESTNRFSGCSGGVRNSDGWIDSLENVVPYIEAELIDDLKRVSTEEGLRALAAKLSKVKIVVDVADEDRWGLGEEDREPGGESSIVLCE
jgi:hypothetical protein